MWPETFGLRTYMYFYTSSMVAQMGLAIWYCRREKLRTRIGIGLGLAYIWGMCVGAKILYDLLHDRFDWRNYLDLQYYVEAGAWGGPLAYLAVAVIAVLLLGRDRRKLLDLVALTLPVPMILAKVACFSNGCCYGAECDLPWAITFPEGAEAPAGIARHPTQLYEIVVLLVILIVLAVLDRKRWKGTLLLWFVAIYGLGRPLTEAFRATDALVKPLGPVTASQAVCLLAAVGAALALAIDRRRSRARPAASSNY